ncbi:MAG TPA: hypothetical protein VMD28_08000, partial [Acidimicrobiales bacterium]|nr:hypothetical protein [Acidimicrobiales bacterium]
MSAGAIVETRQRESRLPQSLVTGLLALVRGPAFFVLALGGLALLLVPLLALVLAVVGFLMLSHAWPGRNDIVLGLLAWGADVLVVR